MSHISATTAVPATSPMTVVCSSISSLLSTFSMAPSLNGLTATSGQHDVVMPPMLKPRYSGGVVGLATVPQQEPQSQIPLQAYANYVLGPPQVGFSFTVEPPTIFTCFVSVLVSAFCFQMPCWMLYSPMGGSTIGVCTIAALLSLPMAGICATW